MKIDFRSLLFPALLLLVCSSCATDNSAAEATAKIDSIVNAEVSVLTNAARQKNDSIIQRLSVHRADSLLADTTLLLIK